MGYIDIKEIPTFTGYSLGQLLSDTIAEYFANPIHQKEFEEWKREREGREDENGADGKIGEKK